MPSQPPSGAPTVYSVLEFERPGGDLVPIGILLSDPISGALHMRMRRDLRQMAGEEDAEVLEALPQDLAIKARPDDLGIEGLFSYLEDTLSGVLRITDREVAQVDDTERTLNRLYRRYVQTNVLPFRTHLPLYTLRAAAGRFLENEEVQEEDWVETPEDLRLSARMFVAHIAGRSMEPLIPDGSLCVFRYDVTGSREGRLVLAESLETTGSYRYAIKRYRSEKAEDDQGWRHSRIRLESLNPGYPSWDLEPDEEKYRIIAEFVRVLE